MDSFSRWIDDHWRTVRAANVVVIVAALGVLVVRSRFGRHIADPVSDLGARDFERRRRLVARVVSTRPHARAQVRGGPAASDVAFLACHQPPAAWLFGLNLWPFVDKQAHFPVRLFGVEAASSGRQTLRGILRPGDLVTVELIGLRPQLATAPLPQEPQYSAQGQPQSPLQSSPQSSPQSPPQPCEVVGHVFFKPPSKWRQENLALDLVRRDIAAVRYDDAPGLLASARPEDLRHLNAFMDTLVAAENKNQAAKEKAKAPQAAPPAASAVGRLANEAKARIQQSLKLSSAPWRWPKSRQ